MKTQAIATLFLTGLFAIPVVQSAVSYPLVAEGEGAYMVIDRVAEGGAERTLNRVAEGGADRTPGFRVAEGGADRTPGFRVAEGGADRTPGFRVAEGGADRTPGFRVAEGGADRTPVSVLPKAVPTVLPVSVSPKAVPIAPWASASPKAVPIAPGLPCRRRWFRPFAASPRCGLNPHRLHPVVKARHRPGFIARHAMPPRQHATPWRLRDHSGNRSSRPSMQSRKGPLQPGEQGLKCPPNH